jgi:hypothetical protein
MHVAANRLTGAAAKLGPDDRALLNLLVNHGVDERSLLRALRTDQAHFDARYQLLAERLGEVLEQPPGYVQEQLDALIESAREHRTTGAATVNGASAPAIAEAPPITVHATERSPDRARRRWRLAALLLLIVIVIVLVAVLSGGSSKRTPAPHAHTGTAGTAPIASTAVRDHATLSTLPGGPAGVTGSIGLTGPAAAPRLVISAAGLPAAGTGHYEVWLYNSVIDSRALASLGTSGGSVTVPLPAHYLHYHWIALSLEPAGSTGHSGLSVLRAAVPGRV